MRACIMPGQPADTEVFEVNKTRHSWA